MFILPNYKSFFFLADGIFRILYEEVDETDVGIVKFPSFNGEAGGMEEYRLGYFIKLFLEV